MKCREAPTWPKVMKQKMTNIRIHMCGLAKRLDYCLRVILTIKAIKLKSHPKSKFVLRFDPRELWIQEKILLYDRAPLYNKTKDALILILGLGYQSVTLLIYSYHVMLDCSLKILKKAETIFLQYL